MEDIDLAIVIADLAGYTALTEAHGGLEAAKVVARYLELAAQAVAPGARLVERVGDEVLIVADHPGSAVRTAVRLRDSVENEPQFPSVRTGVHAGRVVASDGRYFGPPLNLTARLAAHAQAGQVLCTDVVAAACAALDELECRPLGAVRFKNIVEPVQVFEVMARGRRVEPLAIDPVCQMQVRPDTAPARLPLGGVTYHFCSFECAKAFATQPHGYIEA